MHFFIFYVFPFIFRRTSTEVIYNFREVTQLAIFVAFLTALVLDIKILFQREQISLTQQSHLPGDCSGVLIIQS